jgi:DNA gyrase subunit A
MVVIKREGTLLSISENGYGKRTEISGYKVTKRGSKGVITLKTTERNGKLISLLEVVDNDDLMIVTRDGMIIRQSVNKISVIGRNTQGVRLIALNEKDKVYDIARIIAEDETEDEENTESLDKLPKGEVLETGDAVETDNESVEQPAEEKITKETDDVPKEVTKEETVEEAVDAKKKDDKEQELDFGLDS